MARVDFDRVQKVFPGGTRAVNDFTLQIADGELLVVVGPSGCGKSTVLRMLAGLESVSDGDIRIDDRSVIARSPQERNVAMVFQDYALYPHMTVRGNLEFPLKMRGLERGAMAERVRQVAALLDIDPLLDRLPKQLSGGQRQRVAMGRALVREPTAFLLDEPLSNLDAKLRVQVRAEIGALQERTKTTMLYVTHDQVEAMTLGHRVAVMDRGVLQQCAPPTELYAAPANAFVAGFIGNPPMNLFPAQIHGLAVRIGNQDVSLTREPPSASATVGIRPEALRIDSASRPSVTVSVAHVEWLGHETLLHATVPGVDQAGAAIVARIQGMRELKQGDSVRLSFDEQSLYWFDAEGRALRASTP
jgi:ABC-type sugar transport system ATPase subunit